MAAKKTASIASQPSAVTTVPNAFLDDVRSILQRARHQAYAASNFIMVEAYWQIGQRIVQQEQGGQARADYGSHLIRDLARNLGEEFGGGVSVANLKNFRQFYQTFPSGLKSYAVRSLSWTHWRLLMRVDNVEAREYYIRETAEQGWNTRVLERNIASLTFERLLSTSAPAAAAAKPPAQAAPASPHPLEFIKDPYVLEFLGLPDSSGPHEAPLEHQLEAALVLRVRDFLMELGKGFSFVGRQVRISTETSHFFVDLVFYNYLLKCFVLIDLKTRKLSHADIGPTWNEEVNASQWGKLDMYVRMFDDFKRTEGDNPSLGIILCADKDDTIVRYSVLAENPQLFASKYRLVLPSEEELRDELERRQILQIPNNEERLLNEVTNVE